MLGLLELLVHLPLMPDKPKWGCLLVIVLVSVFIVLRPTHDKGNEPVEVKPAAVQQQHEAKEPATQPEKKERRIYRAIKYLLEKE